MAEMILGVVLARGGSKGIPNKNLASLAGRPLIAYTLDAARQSRLLSDVIVSTDSGRIADVVLRLGGRVPFPRPAELATDDTPSVLALRHAVETYERTEGRTVEIVVLLEPTCPLRQATDIDAAIELLLQFPEADSVISGYEGTHVHPMIMYVRSGPYAEPLTAAGASAVRRQDLAPVYVRNGAVYVTRRDLLLKQGRIYGDRPLLYVMPRERSTNIDTQLDLELVGLLLENWTKVQGKE